IRELRQHASRYVARVRAGESVEVSDRGKPVARLVPLAAGQDERAALIARGEIAPAPTSRRAIDASLLAEGDLTGVLDEMRDDR
ncbi:type II toxin-antitoxin system Phd/YefM family antitoxin, partial [Rhodococcus sp. NPDC058514]